jgi:hypothetical protein
MSDLQRRTTPRFALRYRARLEYSLDGSECRLECVTKNVSLAGVLLFCSRLLRSSRCIVGWNLSLQRWESG